MYISIWLRDFWQSWPCRFFLRPLLLLYVLSSLLIILFAESILYQNKEAQYIDTEGIIKLTTEDGKRISAVFLPNSTAIYTILYSHGNGSDLGSSMNTLKDLQQDGFSVMAYDYHGYGTSEGSPSEKNVYHDINAAYAYLTKTLHTTPSHIILYGFSMGGGPSVDLAARKPVAGLILQDCFSSLYRTVTGIAIFPFDKFCSIDKMSKVMCPVLVIHGENDKVIPLQNGKQLFAAAHEPKRSLWVPNADHNNLEEVAGSRYTQALDDFTALLEQQKRAVAIK